MTFFPKQNPVYTCPGCGGTFRQGHLQCLVAHTPGTCCHYGDETILVPQHSGGSHSWDEFRRFLQRHQASEDGR